MKRDTVLPLPEIDGGWGWLVDHAIGVVIAVLSVSLLLGVLASYFISVDIAVSASGALEAQRTWAVRAPAGGIVGRAFVMTGDTVREGDLVAEIDSLSAAADVREAERLLSDSRLDEAQRQALRPFDLQAALRRMELSMSQVTRARASVLSASVAFQRDVDPQRGDLPEPIPLQVARAELAAALAQLGSDSIAYRRLLADSLAGLRARLREAELMERIGRARIRLGRLRIPSPASGVVLTNDIDRIVGRSYAPGEVVAEIADTSGWQAVLFVGERDVRRIEPGQHSTVMLLADEGAADEEYSGKVTFVAAEPDRESAASGATMFRVVVGLQKDGRLRASSGVRRGFSVRARITTGRERVLDHIVRRIFDPQS